MMVGDNINIKTTISESQKYRKRSTSMPPLIIEYNRSTSTKSILKGVTAESDDKQCSVKKPTVNRSQSELHGGDEMFPWKS